jgi:hypothetical protein
MTTFNPAGYTGPTDRPDRADSPPARFEPDHVFSVLLTYCQPLLRLPSPYGDLPVPPDVYGPVTDPAAALARLVDVFGHKHLRRAGLVRFAPGGQPRALARAIVRPGAILVAVRQESTAPPVAVLAGRRAFPSQFCPTEFAVGSAGTQIVLACGTTADVAIFRALGQNATLAAPIRPGGTVELDWVSRLGRQASAENDERLLASSDPDPDPKGALPDFPWAKELPPVTAATDDDDSELKSWLRGRPVPKKPAPPADAGPAPPPTPEPLPATHPSPAPDLGPELIAGPPPAAGPDEPSAAGPVVVLVGWSLLNRSAGVPRPIQFAARHLVDARRHLGIVLDGVLASRLDGRRMELLLYLVRHRRWTALRAHLLEWLGADGVFADVTTLLPDRPPVGLHEAHAALLAAGGDDAERCADVRATYARALEREIAEPLIRQALATVDPLRRSHRLYVATLQSHLIQELIQLADSSGDQDANRDRWKMLLATANALDRAKRGNRSMW